MDKMTKAGATLLAAAALTVGATAPASAYWSHWTKDPNGGRWGSSCPPVVEYHGNGWETVKERRHEQIAYFYDSGWCNFTGYERTGYYTDSFPMYY